MPYFNRLSHCKIKSKKKPRFKKILSDFFPRYLLVLNKYDNDIEEVRIEGHTDSTWGIVDDPMIKYFKNMRLSQGRTRSVLEYVYRVENKKPIFDNSPTWIKSKIVAVGYSSAKLIINKDGRENLKRSRRVEFRINVINFNLKELSF